jgi:hypothetical protein
MRERHFPRMCRPCRAPMARQEDACWRCGTEWAAEDEPRTRLTLIAGGATTAPAASDGGLDADRWSSEGGSVAFEASAVAISKEC